MTHPNRRFVPQAVLTKFGKINTVGASVNTVVRPVNTAGSKLTVNHPRLISNAYKKGYLQDTRPFNNYSEYKIGNPQQKEYKEKGVIDSGISEKGTIDESNLWHRRLGHINFKNMNKLVRGNLVRGNGPILLFDVDSLTISMNYVPVVARNQTVGIAGTRDNIVADHLLPMIDPCITVNAAEASNAFEEHLFERFSPFKNAFTLHAVSNVTQWKI
ncbi:ribonuclease H-like domain-containing protein [Tanacetum coccineum]|uniref:Ribonuclease H-like domain-containing protein n=1 Tax=Tanacetum coccineum TaxID=301880 RepID=A0ABQ4YPL9_9ASTR